MQRAAGIPSRCSCCETLRAPYTRNFSSQTRWIEPVTSPMNVINTSRAGRAPPGKKGADPLRRISWARISSAFSHSRCLRRSRSARAPVRLGSAWASARWTHERSVSAVQPIFPAIDCIAAHLHGYPYTCSWNSRTAFSRTSGECFYAGLPQAPSISSDGASGKHGRFRPQLARHTILSSYYSNDRLFVCASRLMLKQRHVVGISKRR